MLNLTKISFYKYLNVGLLFLLTGFYLYLISFYSDFCRDNQTIECIYEFYDAFYFPVTKGLEILIPILILLLLVPASIFRNWLFCVGAPIILLTFYFVQDISVYGSGFMLNDRTTMAKFGMYVLAGLTLVFVCLSFIYRWYKRQRSR